MKTRSAGLSRRGACALALVLGVAAPTPTQNRIPRWELSRSSSELGNDEIELYRVRGAGLLADGRVAIGDAGNSRIVVATRDGASVARIGRKGGGPGEFIYLAYLGVLRDTIQTYDPGLARVTSWSAEGRPLRSISLATDAKSLLEFRASLSATSVIATKYAGRVSSPTGLFADTVSVVRVDESPSGSATLLGRVPWGYTYVYREPEGTASTGYRTDFLGTGQLEAASGRILFAPLGSRMIEIRRLDWTLEATVDLPVAARSVSQATVFRYRDSLLKAMRASKVTSPRGEARIQGAFGAEFPIPERVASVEAMVRVGESVWVRVIGPDNSRESEWFVVSPTTRRVIGQLSLPRAWLVLGGTEESVAVLRRGAGDVEVVAVHKVQR